MPKWFQFVGNSVLVACGILFLSYQSAIVEFAKKIFEDGYFYLFLLNNLYLSKAIDLLFEHKLSWYNDYFTFLQVGIPIAAGLLFPVNGTMLTPSIAGALMGFSSIGVMTNSLLLRFRFSTKQKQTHGVSPKTEIHVDRDIVDEKGKLKYGQ